MATLTSFIRFFKDNNSYDTYDKFPHLKALAHVVDEYVFTDKFDIGGASYRLTYSYIRLFDFMNLMVSFIKASLYEFGSTNVKELFAGFKEGFDNPFGGDESAIKHLDFGNLVVEWSLPELEMALLWATYIYAKYMGRQDVAEMLYEIMLDKSTSKLYFKNTPYVKCAEAAVELMKKYVQEEKPKAVQAPTQKVSATQQDTATDNRVAELEAEVKRLQEENRQLKEKQPLRDADEELKAENDELKALIEKYQQRGLPPAKRKGIAFGLTPQQAIIFGDYIASKFEISFGNKKEELSIILNCLFGHGISSLKNKVGKINISKEDALYVASIFGPFSPTIAKDICSDWTENTPAPWSPTE